MLCLKAEALDEDHHPQSPNDNSINENGDCNGGNNGGFILPINWWVFFFFPSLLLPAYSFSFFFLSVFVIVNVVCWMVLQGKLY